ncbi:alpha/beta hydrolase [Candidatus Saccharibacteria bacterium]|nr:alpha/beta hydrolase [Candidatus Saccharibacteria bacterium]
MLVEKALQDIANYNGKLGETFYLRDIRLPKVEVSSKLKQEAGRRRFLTNPTTKQRFEARFLNWPDKDSRDIVPVINILPWAAYFAYPAIQYTMRVSGAFYPMPVVLIASLGASRSSKLKQHQHSKIKSDRSFHILADLMLESLKAEGFKKIHLSGYSMGGGVAAALAARAHEYGIEVGLVMLPEPTGLQNLTRADLWHVLTGGDRDDMYGYIDKAGELRFTQNKFRQIGIKLYNNGYLIRRAKAHLSTYPAAIANQNIDKDLFNALDHQPHMRAVVLLARESSVSPYSVSLELRDQIKLKGYSKRCKVVEIVDAHHAVKENNAKFCWLLPYYMVNL